MEHIRACTVMPPARMLGAAEAQAVWECTALRVRFLDGDRALHSRVMDAAQEWTEHCAVRFTVTEAHGADIRVTFRAPGAWSTVGAQARAVPLRAPTMGLGWLHEATREDDLRAVVLHEFGHALGLLHEHQHPRARIRWNKGVVLAYYRQAYGWDAAAVQRNVFDVPPDERAVATAGFDRESIMLYPIPREFVLDPAQAVGWNRELSAGDKAFIRSLYPVPCACEGAS